MKKTRLLFASLLLMALWGCDSVTSSTPVGDKPVSLQEDDWDGTWINAESALTLKVKNAEKGHLQIAWIEDSGGKLKMESFIAEIRVSGDWHFASIRDDGGDQEIEERYMFLRVDKSDGQIIGWSPDVAAFKKAVEDGHLPGKMDESSVRLSVLNSEHIDYIKSAAATSLFDWDEPLVLVRIGK
jgi:hypothetical protein